MCIIRQLDFKAGTSGDGACILSGKERPAKPIIKSDIGLLMEPIIEVFVFPSRMIVVKVIPQVKNSKDSYRLLKGK
mgnify:CR=1 FL=1